MAVSTSPGSSAGVSGREGERNGGCQLPVQGFTGRGDEGFEVGVDPSQAGIVENVLGPGHSHVSEHGVLGEYRQRLAGLLVQRFR